jgi:hypothetical protein
MGGEMGMIEAWGGGGCSVVIKAIPTAHAVKEGVRGGGRGLSENVSILFSLKYFFYSEDGGDTFLRNVDSYKIHTASHPTRRLASKFRMFTKV